MQFPFWGDFLLNESLLCTTEIRHPHRTLQVCWHFCEYVMRYCSSTALHEAVKIQSTKISFPIGTVLQVFNHQMHLHPSWIYYSHWAQPYKYTSRRLYSGISCPYITSYPIDFRRSAKLPTPYRHADIFVCSIGLCWKLWYCQSTQGFHYAKSNDGCIRTGLAMCRCRVLHLIEVEPRWQLAIMGLGTWRMQ